MPEICILSGMEKILGIRQKYLLLDEHLNELTRRYWAATEALTLGYGGIAIVAEATGLSRRTIERGIRQIKSDNADYSRQRAALLVSAHPKP